MGARGDCAGALDMNLEGSSRGGEFGMSSVSCGNGKLRQWLIDQIDSGKYPGLVWENEEKSIFRIPWKHAGKQDYNREEDAALFKVPGARLGGVGGQRPARPDLTRAPRAQCAAGRPAVLSGEGRAGAPERRLASAPSSGRRRGFSFSSGSQREDRVPSQSVWGAQTPRVRRRRLAHQGEGRSQAAPLFPPEPLCEPLDPSSPPLIHTRLCFRLPFCERRWVCWAVPLTVWSLLLCVCSLPSLPEYFFVFSLSVSGLHSPTSLSSLVLPSVCLPMSHCLCLTPSFQVSLESSVLVSLPSPSPLCFSPFRFLPSVPLRVCLGVSLLSSVCASLS